MKKTVALLLIIPLLLLGLAFGLDGLAQANAQKSHIWLLETLLPGGSDFVRLPYQDDTIRSVHQADNGFVIETVTQGYADEIRLFVGVNNDGKVTGLVVQEAHETPTLGNSILTDHEFLAQFLNQSGSFTLGTVDAHSGATAEVETAGEEISVDGISGATVSSRAVARCVSAAVAYVTGADIGSSATP